MAEKVEHGIKSAWYANTPSGLVAVLECLCGQECSSETRFWEETGRELDEHLEEVANQ